jgi:hypothetical protein
MSTRRGSPAAHVRPRPPSSGRPAPAKAKARRPAPGRLAVHTPIRRSRGIPLVGRLLLITVVVAIAVGVLYIAVGGANRVMASLSSSVGGFIQGVTATPVPSATPLAVSDAPSIESPSEPYTKSDSVDLVVTVPASVVGDPDSVLRVYLALANQQQTPIQDVPLAAIPRNIIPVTLTKGTNDFSVSIVGPGGESEQSGIIRYILDQSKPSLKVTSPSNGAIVNGKAVKVKGKTQARSTVSARNVTSGDSIIVTADGDGLFTLSLPLATGSNQLQLTSTDPAGNQKTTSLSVRRGSGKLTVSLSSSDYRLSRKSLPTQIRLTAVVMDPDGRPLEGASVTFTLSIPGVPALTQDARTDANGRAIWRTTIPSGATTGGGIAAVDVTTNSYGSKSDSTVITVTK